MRIALATLLTLALLPLPLPAQQEWANKMFVDGTLHQFGNVPHGSQLFHRFKITNIYAVPLEVMNIHTSCGCVSASCATKILQTRESGFIDVSMDARKFKNGRTVKILVD